MPGELTVPEWPSSAAVADVSFFASAFSCYTAALAVWLGRRQHRWWRPLLAGGPVLAVTPAAGGLMRFEHHSRPPLEALGLTAAYASEWATAQAAHQAALARSGALIVCGDVYNLPWQRGHRHWHAPHWFTILARKDGLVVVDPLAMSTPAGPQLPSLVPVDPVQIALWSSAPPCYAPVHRLRELSIAGDEPTGLAARYRWLATSARPRTGQRDPARLTGADAVLALATRFGRARPDDPIHDQADDLWQALRQRELVIAAAKVDPELVDPAAADHWQRAIVGWRRIPAALMHAKLRREAGLPVDFGRLADALMSVAAFEGRHQMPDEIVAEQPRAADDAGD